MVIDAGDGVITGMGTDLVYGGAGNDMLWGGLGKDTFVFNTKPNKSTNMDKVIYDKATGSLYYDRDGTGSDAQVKIGTLANKAGLALSDFLIV